MLTVRSMTTGKILGFAHSHEDAKKRADENQWRNWVIEEVDLPELRLVESHSTDPRNRRGERCHG
jgi:hypothetical protein